MPRVDVGEMRRAGAAARAVLDAVGAEVRPGVSTGYLNRVAKVEILRRGARSTQFGYHGFPAVICTSRNHVVCHGIPSDEEILIEGDLLNVDVTLELGGWVGDCSITFPVGKVHPKHLAFIRVARQCRDAGVAAIRPGGRLGDIGAAIVAVARAAGCSVVREYGGHGIGRQMHEPPHVPHVGRAGTGPVLRPGMAITVEPMINLGGPAVRMLQDGWTVVTADGSLSAQFEHTVVITEGGPVITTGESATAC